MNRKHSNTTYSNLIKETINNLNINFQKVKHIKYIY